MLHRLKKEHKILVKIDCDLANIFTDTIFSYACESRCSKYFEFFFSKSAFHASGRVNLIFSFSLGEYFAMGCYGDDTFVEGNGTATDNGGGTSGGTGGGTETETGGKSGKLLYFYPGGGGGGGKKKKKNFHFFFF